MFFVASNFDLYSASVCAIMFTKLCYTGLRYNDTRCSLAFDMMLYHLAKKSLTHQGPDKMATLLYLWHFEIHFVDRKLVFSIISGHWDAADCRNPSSWKERTCLSNLTNWGWEKTADILQTTFSNAFSWMKIFAFDWGLFLRVQSTIMQQWFR